MNSMIRLALSAGALMGSGGAHAITITATQDATTLVNALLAGANTGIVVTGATLNGHSQVVDLSGLFPGLPAATLTSSGTYTNASGTYGIGPGVVLSTGGVEGITVDVGGGFPPETFVAGYSDGPNTQEGNGWAFGGTFPPGLPDPNDPGGGTPGLPATSAQEALLDPITQNPACDPGPVFCSHYDVTELIINFDMQAGFTQVAFNIVFGSEEWPEFRDSPFIDGFGMFLNGVNIAAVGGFPVNIRHPDMRPLVDENQDPVPGTTIPGTELDGILGPGGNPVLTFTGLVNPTGNQLRFIVADTSDGVLDTTVYFSALTGVPAPPAVWLLGTGVAGLACRRLLKKRELPASEAT
ncbi:MAG: choice-of-anchor L domain-containing protein [Chromatiales bacterium]|nr:choice-of-anchor L domain-containing protein [Chromatiales bacterium]